eukprot:scpid82068/ scgid10904/ Carbonyl reductase [NADPH] 3; NADPH-dependent carbonyl reductase 3
METASKPVAVVTGSNKGIGLAIVESLYRKFSGDVVLTARDVGRGESACAELLRQKGLKPVFHQLDITDDGSVRRLAAFLQSEYGGLDVLVNNAGIYVLAKCEKSPAEKARITMETNFFATHRVCQVLFPLLRAGARVVNVASGLGRLSKVGNEGLQEQLVSPQLTESDLLGMARDYVAAAANESGDTAPWPADSAYSMSKVFLIGLTRIQARDVTASRPAHGILINSCCPGFVDTDLNEHRGRLTVEEGAETPVVLALLDKESPSGQFYKNTQVCEW